MKLKVALFVVLVVSIFLLGCQQQTQPPSGFATQPGGQPSPFVGGGCGVAPDGNYEDSEIPVSSANSL